MDGFYRASAAEVYRRGEFDAKHRESIGANLNGMDQVMTVNPELLGAKR